MGFAFNPFTGTFDVKGAGGGGGSAFFAGEVPTYADLPLDGTAALDSRWLVRSNSGTWPFSSYKQAGVYVRLATVGSSRDNDYRLTDTSFFDVMSDSAFLLYDDGDATKNLKFQLSGISTGTTRTLTAPNASGRIQVEGQPIGNTTPAAGTFTTLAANNGTLTASAPVLDLAQTWNNAAVTFRGVNWSFVETAAAGSSEVFRISTGAAGTTAIFNIRRDGNATFANAVNVGTVGGTVGLAMQGTSVRVGSNGFFAFASLSGNAYGTTDVALFRDAAATLALRDGTNPQTFRLYNTYTDASNHERGFMRWSSNVLQIGTEAAGTGTNRNLELHSGGALRMTLSTASGVVLPGASALAWGGGGSRIIGATSPAGLLQFQTGSTDRITIDANGIIGIGGTTSSFPALKRSLTALQVRLADDSADAPLSASLFSVGSGAFDGVIGRPNAGVIGFARADGATTYIAALGFDGTTRALVANSAAFVGWSNGNASSVAAGDTRLWRDAAGIVAQRNGATGQAFRIYNTDGTNFERLNLRWASNEFIIDAEAGGTGTLRGIKIGSATSSLLGFYGVTPVDQPATVADPAGGGTVDTEARTAINAVIDRLQELGLIA